VRYGSTNDWCITGGSMINLLVGFILGIVVSTVGFSGIAKMADKSIDKVKEVTIEQTK
jgi:hypothetical protein